MSRQWKPGDVAIVMTDGGERVAFRCGVLSNLGWEYARNPGEKTWSSDASGYATPIRPLIVIDAEDREQVKRLFDAYCTTVNRNRVDAMQTALRSLIAPPKPEEPTGLGAVVEDAEGVLWVRHTNAGLGNMNWRNDAKRTVAKWRAIAAVRVLSEGVSA